VQFHFRAKRQESASLEQIGFTANEAVIGSKTMIAKSKDQVKDRGKQGRTKEKITYEFDNVRTLKTAKKNEDNIMDSF